MQAYSRQHPSYRSIRVDDTTPPDAVNAKSKCPLLVAPSPCAASPETCAPSTGGDRGRIRLERLRAAHPGTHPDNLLRTIQRRVKVWRSEMARTMVFDDLPAADDPIAGADSRNSFAQLGAEVVGQPAPPSHRDPGGSNGSSERATACLRDTPATRRENSAAPFRCGPRHFDPGPP